MQNIKSKLTKTPYLVLFIVLITFSITSASALTITLSGDLIEFLGMLDMNNNKITNLAEPTIPVDAATKNYVDNNNFQFIKTVERTGSFVLISGFGEANVTASCIGNEVATGGGWIEDVHDDDPVIFDSVATFTDGVPTGWRVFFGNLEGGNESLAATVICATLQNTSPFP